jgi:hypothetical protein
MSKTRTTHDGATGRRLSARRARVARGQLASYIHEVSDRHRDPQGRVVAAARARRRRNGSSSSQNSAAASAAAARMYHGQGPR